VQIGKHNVAAVLSCNKPSDNHYVLWVWIKCWGLSLRAAWCTKNASMCSNVFFPASCTVPYSIECSWRAQLRWWVTGHKGRSAFPSINHCQGQLQTLQCLCVSS
jgi:hypothetical protein